MSDATYPEKLCRFASALRRARRSSFGSRLILLLTVVRPLACICYRVILDATKCVNRKVAGRSKTAWKLGLAPAGNISYYQVTVKTAPIQRTVKTSISLEPDLLELSRAVARTRGYRHSFSAYVAQLLRKDVECLATIKPLSVLTQT